MRELRAPADHLNHWGGEGAPAGVLLQIIEWLLPRFETGNSR